MPKTVLPSKFAEWRGLDRISATVHEMRCIFREISKDDFGLDGEIEVVVPKPGGEGFQTADGIIKVQAKSGQSYVRQDSPTGFVTPVEKTDLEGWYASNFPVAFIVYHPGDDALYWKEVKSYVRNTPAVFSSPFRIDFDKAADRFSADCYERVRQLAAAELPRISLKDREKLFCNLFPILRMPRRIYYAPTRFTRAAHARQAVDGFVAPFEVIPPNLYTLADLRDRRVALRSACDVRQVRDVSLEEWTQDPDRRNTFVFLLNLLLGSHLRRLGLRYVGGSFRRNYFPRENPTAPEFRREWFNVRTGRKAPARIVAKHYKYGRDEFWRHQAANVSFRQFGGQWYLQIIPKYFFTVDGEMPYDNEKVGPYTTRIRAVERNYHVLNHLLFWSDVLSQGQPAIDLRLDGRTLVSAAKEPLSGIAPFAIPYDPAVYEDSDSGQMEMDFGALGGAQTEADDDEVDDVYLD